MDKPSDLEKIFTYLSEAEKERANNWQDLDNKLGDVLEALERLETIWEKS